MTLHVEKRSDSVIELIETVTERNGLTGAEVDARVDKKLEEINKTLEQHAGTMSELKEMMRILVSRSSEP